MKNILLTFASAVLIAGCGAETAPPQSAKKQQPPAPAPAMNASGSPAKLTGKVLESHDAAGYTYIRLDTGGEPRWAAVTQAPVRKGQQVTVNAQMTMEQFESKTLNRKFDKIVFGTIDAPGVAGTPAPMTSAAQHMSVPAATVDVHVPKAEGANAMTVAQIWSAKPGDQRVVVRGRVVKFLSGIMGKNWLHIRDGSGSAEKGDHDLTVTTKETATVGDVVVVSGIVRVDKDFGAGYRYPVIVEEATLSR